jgi:RNA polymerase sigma-70 factor (ECF subfamily)
MYFPTTHWSALAKATLSGDAQSRAALEELCRRYWQPLYQFVRARGIPESEAQDVTQSFMVHLMQHSVFNRADREQGRFRSFLLGALSRFLADEWDRRNAQKRGKGIEHVSFEGARGPLEVASLSSQDGTVIFDREWALTIMEASLGRLRSEFKESRREDAFEVLKSFLPGGPGAAPYEDAAGRLGVSLPAFKSELHRLRGRFRELVRLEVAQTVSAPHEIDDEMNHLQRVLMDKGFEPRRET